VPENAASQLRAVLPPDLAARLDLGRLAAVPAGFVDEALRWRYSDLLFTAPLLLQTAPGNPKIPAELRPWSAQLRAILDQPGGGEAFIALLTYIELVSEVPASDLHDLAASLGPDAEEAYMTTADMLRAEGRAEGEVRGLAKGLVRMLTVKFGPLPEDLAGKVHAASTSQVETWTDRAVTADTLDQVFS
jgi:hypothetical protein